MRCMIGTAAPWGGAPEHCKPLVMLWLERDRQDGSVDLLKESPSDGRSVVIMRRLLRLGSHWFEIRKAESTEVALYSRLVLDRSSGFTNLLLPKHMPAAEPARGTSAQTRNFAATYVEVPI